MKRIIHLMAGLMLAGCMASCSEDPDTPQITTVETVSGLYLINNGNMSSNIQSSITRYDYSTGTATPALQDAFQTANGIALGVGAQPALVYGSRMYIPMYDSNIIWVVDAATLKQVGTIRPEANLGPWGLAAEGGHLYASMFNDGSVCRIDTVSLKIDRTVKTGPNPDKICIAGGKLYVANSDGYNWNGNYAESSISIIDLASFTEAAKIKDIDKVMNPTDMVTNGSEVFVVCKGNYADVPSTVKRIKGTDVEDVALGNYMTVADDRLYVINDVYGEPREDMAFDVYNTVSLRKEGEIAKQTKGTDSWIDAPSCIAVDPVGGDIVITSYHLTEAGWSQYSEPGYANIYDKEGNFKKRIEGGVGTIGIAFIHKTITE